MAEKNEDVETLERGDIWFFYRPRVEEESPSKQGDLQRFYMVMNPRDDKNYRLTIIGGKELPDPSKSGRAKYWGFVDTVRSDPRSIDKVLGAETYQTKTRGERHLPAARPAGEGKYRILRHGDHTHLAYALELPKKPREVQKALNIEDEASYIISVKNPKKGAPAQAGLGKEQKADLPKDLQERFEGRRFVDVDPPRFLDKEGVEFLLVAAAEDLKEDLGIEIRADTESCRSADVFQDLKLDRDEHPTEPLCEGKWA